jgi:hypothetical protein
VSQPVNFAVINYAVYEKGFEARLRREPKWQVILKLNWLLPSWRAGWSDAGQELHLHPELKLRAKQRSRKKGNK